MESRVPDDNRFEKGGRFLAAFDAYSEYRDKFMLCDMAHRELFVNLNEPADTDLAVEKVLAMLKE